MSINHHPDDATLLSFAAGCLPESFDVLVTCHLQRCKQCSDRVRDAEQLGAALIEAETPAFSGDARARFMDMLDEEPLPLCAREEPGIAASVRAVPQLLKQVLEQGDKDLVWKTLVPGIRQIRLDTQDGGLRLLKISPGISIPLHSHAGSELTLVLQGSYSDELGRFVAGDVSDLGAEVEHQPITDGADPCICLVATDAGLRFRGLLPKLLQPFTGF